MPTPRTAPPGLVSIDPDGYPTAARTAIVSVGTSVAAGATDSPVMTVPFPNDVPFIQRITGVCTVAPTASGQAVFETEDGGGGSEIVSLDLLLTAHVIGSVIEIVFDTPLRGAAGEAVVVTTGANTGTWTWYLSGYAMDRRVD